MLATPPCQVPVEHSWVQMLPELLGPQGLGLRLPSLPTQCMSRMPTARQAAAFDPAELVSPSWGQQKPWGRDPQGWLCHSSLELQVWLCQSHHLLLFKKVQEAFGTASKQHRLTLQACILHQFRSNTEEIPNQRAFYFLCFPCNPPDCLPVPGSAAGLKASSLFSHAGELVLSALPWWVPALKLPTQPFLNKLEQLLWASQG